MTWRAAWRVGEERAEHAPSGFAVLLASPPLLTLRRRGGAVPLRQCRHAAVGGTEAGAGEQRGRHQPDGNVHCRRAAGDGAGGDAGWRTHRRVGPQADLSVRIRRSGAARLPIPTIRQSLLAGRGGATAGRRRRRHLRRAVPRDRRRPDTGYGPVQRHAGRHRDRARYRSGACRRRSRVRLL